MQDLQDFSIVTEELGAKFTEFKEANNKNLEAIQAEKTALNEKVDALNEKLSALEKAQKGIEQDLNQVDRPINDTKAHMLELKKAFYAFVTHGIQTKQFTATTDGYMAIPHQIAQEIIQVERKNSPMRSVCNQVTLSTPEYSQIVNLGGAKSGWVYETQDRPETNSPTLHAVKMTVGEIYANPQITATALNDVFFNAEAWFIDEIGRAFAEEEDITFLKKTNPRAPNGIFDSPLTLHPDAIRAFNEFQKLEVSKDITLNSLIDLTQALQSGYRQHAVFMLNNLAVMDLRKLQDKNGQYLWQPSLIAGTPSTLLGYDIVENENLSLVSSATNNKNLVLFGDFKRSYTIGDIGQLQFIRDVYTQKPFVKFYTTKRVGGMVTDTRALKVLVVKK